jgi:hypothetical protein
MDISFEIAFLDDEQAKLARILNCKQTEVAGHLQSHAKAALIEYTEMYLGRSNPTTAPEFRERRLLNLIQHVHEGNIPDEAQVGKLFHLTGTQSRTLIRSVLAKHQVDLEDGIRSQYAEMLEKRSQRESDGSYEVNIRSSAVVDGLNGILLDIDGGLPRISRKRGTTGVYVVDVASYNRLREVVSPSDDSSGDE